MRKIFSLEGGGVHVGSLPLGCLLCLKGAKLVVFVTGKCPLDCFYCPVSRKRRKIDAVYANERRVEGIEEIIEEAEVCDAEGASLTGGEPLYVFERTISVIKALKQHFGPSFHVHLYTGAKNIPRDKIQLLDKAGLDEIRLHNIEYINDESIMELLDTTMAVGVEIPAVPGCFERVVEQIQRLEKIIGGKRKTKNMFLVLDEFEASETNIEKVTSHGFKLRKNAIAEIAGSMETAKAIIDWARQHSKIAVHYCPSRSKDTVQLKNRFIRRAKNIRRPFERVTEEGLITKGVVVLPEKAGLDAVRQKIIDALQLDGSMVYINRERG
ncbi:MAG: radical SAM protein, partial [Candidatus Ranarchaeia archaeon]